MFLLTAFTVVVAIVLVYIFFSLMKAGETKLADDPIFQQEWGPLFNDNNREELINMNEGFAID